MPSSSDPMGQASGRVLLNGNAESADRFVALLERGIDGWAHRDPSVADRRQILLVTASWGRGELRDGGIRGAFEHRMPLGRHQTVSNLELWTSVRRFLQRRSVVQALYDEHQEVHAALVEAYGEENDALVARVRAAWKRAQEALAGHTMPQLLQMGDRPPPGPPTRPVTQLLQVAVAGQVRRAVDALVEADDRHAGALGELWGHFRLAAGLEFDPLWRELRRGLAQQILDASIVALAGGSPGALLDSLRFFRLAPVLVEALRRGTTFYGSSAGAMVLGRRVVVFHDHGDPRQEFQLLDLGAGLMHGLQVFPHVMDRVQTDDPANLAYLAARFRHRACVGLNAGSVLLLEADGGRWRGRSVGDEDVVVFGQAGNKQRYGAGEEVPEVA